MSELNEEVIKGYTWNEYMETARKLARDPELRAKVEKEMQEEHPDYVVKIDSRGFAHMSAKNVHVSSRVK